MIEDDRLYTDAEVRRLLKVDRRTLLAWRGAGKLVALHLSSRCLRYRGADVRTFLERAAGRER